MLNHKGKVAAERVYVVNVLGTIDCGDQARSQGVVSQFERDQGAFSDCTRLAIDESKVPKETILFRCSLFPRAIFIRDDLKQRMEQAGMIARYIAPGDPLS